MDEKYLFPFKTIRDEQSKLIEDVAIALENRDHVLVNAPTGLGKTISTIGPALKHALKNNLKVFFITPRHTQHRIAIDTLKDIKEDFKLDFHVVDFIGKKWMCPMPGTDSLYSSQFADFCSSQKEERKCEYYNRTKKSDLTPTVEAQALVEDLEQRGPLYTEEIIKASSNKHMCAYEISALLARKSAVVIADYFHILHPSIRELFLGRCNCKLEKSIVIIDEGHNLPSRVRDLMSVSLTTFILNAAIKEAKKFGYDETQESLEKILATVKEMADDLEESGSIGGNEKLITRDEFIKEVNKINDYIPLIAGLTFIADEVREMKKKSFIGSVANFLDQWRGDDFGYTRILRKNEKRIELVYRCLDPSLITAPMIEESYSTIVMSGTLEPLDMYKDLLGFPENVELKSYKNPFKKENRLSLIIPQTSTKYSVRSEQMYEKIAKILADVTNIVPGNCAIFFPSYRLRNSIYEYFYPQSKKIAFLEDSGLTKRDKEGMLSNFKKYKDSGAILLGAISGSFSEGIDLPGDFLKCVVVVGVPLSVPDLETKKLIEYYDEKFKRGMDYGYLMPAMTRCLQGAGRCIRSETDKGAIIFLDKRFTWTNYYKCFPKDLEIKITNLYKERVEEFFGT